MTKAMAKKIRQYETRRDANINGMFLAIQFGKVEMAGTCAWMAAHYARSAVAAREFAAAVDRKNP